MVFLLESAPPEPWFNQLDAAPLLRKVATRDSADAGGGGAEAFVCGADAPLLCGPILRPPSMFKHQDRSLRRWSIRFWSLEEAGSPRRQQAML